MINLETVPTHYEDAVALLANWHRNCDDPDFAAYSFPDPEGTTVRLVEISSRFPSVDAVRPLHFGRSADFPFPSAVALVSIQNWDQISSGNLALPEGWFLQSAQPVRLSDQQ